MRILLLNDYQRHGGVEVVVEQTARILQQAGHEVRVLAGDQVVRSQRPLSYIASSPCKRAVSKAIKEFRPDAIHIHNLYHLLSPAVLEVCYAYRIASGCRIVMSVHDHHLVCPNPGGCFWKQGQRVAAEMPINDGLVGMLRKRWDHRSAFHSVLRVLQRYWNYTRHQRHLIPNVLISPSQDLAELMQQFGHPDVRVVHNPLPIPPAQSERDEDVDLLRVVVVGRVDPEKGVAELIKHWPTNLPSSLQIVGDGTELNRCRQIAMSRMQRDDTLVVEFLGQVSHEDSMRAISRSDVLIVPSLGSEVAPLVIDEAMVAGSAVLVSDQPALRNAIEGSSSSWVFNPNNPTDLQTKLLHIDSERMSGTLRSENATKRPTQGRSDKEFLAALLSAYANHDIDADPANGSLDS
ncbi:MAG: glycosyltransferase [Phycisphaerales bacterium]